MNQAYLIFYAFSYRLTARTRYTLDYICKKTPWAADDDLPSFFGGVIDIISKKKGVEK